MLGHSAQSQKMDLMWISVWRAKCNEFHEENQLFHVGAQRLPAEYGPNVDLSMESKMQ